MHFAENYSFIIQQSVQAFYYNNLQATIHPFCLYYKDPHKEGKDQLKQLSFCVISDTKDHFSYTVHVFQNQLLQVLKRDFSCIKSIIYYSDGTPTQYKNKNNLVNVCHHEKDFGMKVTSYNLFITSHGKSVCDGIGTVIKRTTMRHCIRSPPEKQITNPLETYEYVSKELISIRTLWVPDTEVQESQRRLKKRFDSALTIKEKRLHHCYRPINENTLEIGITSFDKQKKNF